MNSTRDGVRRLLPAGTQCPLSWHTVAMLPVFLRKESHSQDLPQPEYSDLRRCKVLVQVRYQRQCLKYENYSIVI